MSRQSSQRKSSRSLSASHQRSWLWGRYAVQETLTAGHWPVIELLVDEELPVAQVHELHDLVSQRGLRQERVPARRLTELCRSEDHQGFIARMGEFPCSSLEDLTARLALSRTAGVNQQNAGEKLFPLYVICDRIQDAHNFGAILRSCDAMNVDGVIIGEKSQVSVTPHVARASSGAVNHQTIFSVPSLTEAARTLAAHGVQLLAATEKTQKPLWTIQGQAANAVVIGSEATGISPELLAECRTQISIPMLGGVASLNAAVAAGIVLYEVRRQQMGSMTAADQA